jgi:hypothetical protein
MSLLEKENLLIEMKKALSEAKKLHAPTIPLIYSIGNKAYFILR